MNKKGQTVLSEHVMIFFVVIAALVAMTTFVQRSFEARIHDAHTFMINAVMNSSVCDANCLAATGKTIAYEYEPYYEQRLSDVRQTHSDMKGITNGSAASIGAVYSNSINEQTVAISFMGQLPPECADGAKSTIVNCSNL